MGFDIDPNVYFSPKNAPHDPYNDTDKPDNAPDQEKISIYNGFDMRGAESVVHFDKKKRCKECPGYYHFEAVQPKESDPGILAVVIDTSAEDFHFSKGSVCRNKNAAKSKDKDKKDKDKCNREQREQIDWLENVLKKYANEGNWMVLAFGHHALNSKYFYDESYKQVTDLFHNPRYNVIAYFCGHSHKHLVKYHRNKNHPESFGFWEITTDSIIEYPKKGSLVNIVYDDENGWALTLQSFWPYFLDKDLLVGAHDIDMLQNAEKCFEASKVDDKGRKKKDYDKLHAKHHDAVLPFSFPKSGNK